MAVNAFLVCVGAVCLGAVARAAGLPAEPSSTGAVVPKCERAANPGIFFFKRVFEPCVYLCSGIPISFENEDDGTPCQRAMTSPPMGTVLTAGGVIWDYEFLQVLQVFVPAASVFLPPKVPTTEAAIPTTAALLAQPAPEELLKGSESNSAGAEAEVPASPSTGTPQTALEEGENEDVAKDSENDVAIGSGDAPSSDEDNDVANEGGKAPVAEESEVADEERAEESQNDVPASSADAPTAGENSAVTAEESEAPGAEDSQANEEEQAKPAGVEDEEGSGLDDSAAPVPENAAEEEDVATLQSF